MGESHGSRPLFSEDAFVKEVGHVRGCLGVGSSIAYVLAGVSRVIIEMCI